MPSRTLQEAEAENRLLRREHGKLRWRLKQVILCAEEGLARVGEFADAPVETESPRQG